MNELSNSRSAATELLLQFHANEVAFLKSKTELTDYLRTLVGSNVSVKGFTSQVIVASSVTPEGQVQRRTSVSSYRRFDFVEDGEDEQKLVRTPTEIKRARLDDINRRDELSVSLTDIELPVVQYQALGYILQLNDIIRLEPVPTLVKQQQT